MSSAAGSRGSARPCGLLGPMREQCGDRRSAPHCPATRPRADRRSPPCAAWPRLGAKPERDHRARHCLAARATGKRAVPRPRPPGAAAAAAAPRRLAGEVELPASGRPNACELVRDVRRRRQGRSRQRRRNPCGVGRSATVSAFGFHRHALPGRQQRELRRTAPRRYALAIAPLRADQQRGAGVRIRDTDHISWRCGAQHEAIVRHRRLDRPKCRFARYRGDAPGARGAPRRQRGAGIELHADHGSRRRFCTVAVPNTGSSRSGAVSTMRGSIEHDQRPALPRRNAATPSCASPGTTIGSRRGRRLRCGMSRGCTLRRLCVGTDAGSGGAVWGCGGGDAAAGAGCGGGLVASALVAMGIGSGFAAGGGSAGGEAAAAGFGDGADGLAGDGWAAPVGGVAGLPPAASRSATSITTRSPICQSRRSFLGPRRFPPGRRRQ